MTSMPPGEGVGALAANTPHQLGASLHSEERSSSPVPQSTMCGIPTGLGGVAVVVAGGAAKLESVGDRVTGLFVRGNMVIFE